MLAAGRDALRPARSTSVALTCVAVALVVAPLSMSRASVVLALAAFLFLTGFVLHVVEARCFSSAPSPVGARQWLGAAVIASLFALGGAFFAEDGNRSAAAAIEAYVRERGGSHTLLALALSSISFMVAYCVIGSATFPFVRRHDERPERVMELRVPTGGVVILQQLARGLAATLVLFPLIAAGFAREPLGWAKLGAVWAIVGAIVPLLDADGWPWRLRAIHMLEITLFAFVQSYAWWRFLA